MSELATTLADRCEDCRLTVEEIRERRRISTVVMLTVAAPPGKPEGQLCSRCWVAGAFGATMTTKPASTEAPASAAIAPAPKTKKPAKASS